MNGIIHNCTHGNNPDVKLTEDEMVVAIFAYLDKLFHIVKPQKVIFMAIDGVAPRAKMNQQRARRFKSAKEAEEAAIAAARRGEVVPDADSRFDSNCITPGTPFMARLGAHLRFFIRKKISEDVAWQKPTVIFSGHEVPGEGEHKIMEYIRWAKKAPGYAPNTRHCLYGLDADLVMLSLVTHEPHFNLLREVVSYGAGGRGQPAREVLENPCQEHFVLLQIGLLRDYFDMEFKSLADTLPFAYDLERIVDDFVLFCMLVGNDFLPPLPTVDINEGSLDSMFDLYRQLLPSLGGYLTYAGELHRGRLEVFMKALADQEADVLEARAQDTEEYESKKASRADKGGKGGPAWASAPLPAKGAGVMELDADDVFALEMAKLALQTEGHEMELLALQEGEEIIEEIDGEFIAVSAAGAVPVADPSAIVAAEKAPEGPTMMSQEARDMFLNGDKDAGLAAWRNRYYREKIKVADGDRRSVMESYIQGLHWVLEYYYRGVVSWNWFYPHHYAPMASDFTSLASVKVAFSLGEPFKPFEQLLAVQPSSSCRLLPDPFRWLMTDANSPIADFYPTEFEVDLEGKRADWEGVVMISFIDQDRLLAAARSVSDALLTSEEKSRNKLGDIMVFGHSIGSKESTFCTSTLPAMYTSVSSISNSTAMVQSAPPPLPPGEKGFIPSFVPGTKVGATGPAGFPTLRTLAVNAELRRAGINVFGMTSRKESLILKVKELPGAAAPTAAQVATAVVGQRAWVKWPYLQEALVVAVSDGRERAGAAGDVRPLSSSERDEFDRQIMTLNNDYLSKQGLELGQIQLLLHVRPCEGLVRQIDGTIEKRFGKTEAVYPLQVTLRRNPSPDPRFQADGTTPIDGAAVMGLEPLNEGDEVVFLGRAHYGCIAKVLPGGPRGLDKRGKALDKDGTSSSNGTDTKSNAVNKGPYRVEILPAPPSAAQAAQAARRILSNVTVSYQASGQVARRLGVSSRSLGRMTGNVWVQIGEDRRDRIDIGLCVKNGAKGLFVPDYCAPIEPSPYQQQQAQQQGQEPRKGGWAYSDAMIRVLEQYKQKFAWVWTAVEKQESSSTSSFASGGGGKSGPPQALTLEELFPGMDNDAAVAQVTALRKWLKSTPLSRRPLVKPTAKVAPESAVRMLQAALPPNISKTSPPVELENVAPALLMAPLVKGGTASAFAGGNFEIGDRVITVRSSGAPAFGSRGTVVGVYDEAVEVLFDSEFLGGNDLFGRCNGDFGAMLPADQILNLSRPHAVKAEGAAAFKMVRKITGLTTESGGGSGTTTGGSGAAAGDAPLSAAQALAAASAALQGKGAPKPPSGPEPRIPDKSGSKGFAWGTGRGVPVGIKAAAAEKKKTAPGAPAAANAGAQLLAQLTRSAAASTAPGAVQPPSLSHPPPPPQQQQHHHPGMQMPMPPPPPHMMMMMGHPPPPPPGGPYPYPLPPPSHPGMVPMHPPYPMLMPPPHPGMMMYGGPPPAPQQQQQPQPDNNQGNNLLAQLQRGQPPSAPPNPGSALLSQLQGRKKQQPVPQSPPTNAGSLLLQQLQQNSPKMASASEKKKKPAADSGGGNFAAMWERMQKHGDKVAAAAAPPPPPAAVAPAPDVGDDAGGPAPPPAPSAAMLHGASGGNDADAFWDMMTNPAAAGGGGGGGGGKKGGTKKK
jgi:5'-3' exoribonuclease 1